MYRHVVTPPIIVVGDQVSYFYIFSNDKVHSTSPVWLTFKILFKKKLLF